MPALGIYAVWARIAGEDVWRAGAMSVGIRPTFDGVARSRCTCSTGTGTSTAATSRCSCPVAAAGARSRGARRSSPRSRLTSSTHPAAPRRARERSRDRLKRPERPSHCIVLTLDPRRRKRRILYPGGRLGPLPRPGQDVDCRVVGLLLVLGAANCSAPSDETRTLADEGPLPSHLLAGDRHCDAHEGAEAGHHREVQDARRGFRSPEVQIALLTEKINHPTGAPQGSQARRSRWPRRGLLRMAGPAPPAAGLSGRRPRSIGTERSSRNWDFVAREHPGDS